MGRTVMDKDLTSDEYTYLKVQIPKRDFAKLQKMADECDFKLVKKQIVKFAIKFLIRSYERKKVKDENTCKIKDKSTLLKYKRLMCKDTFKI
jgi:hypothetical protein